MHPAIQFLRKVFGGAEKVAQKAVVNNPVVAAPRVAARLARPVVGQVFDSSGAATPPLTAAPPIDLKHAPIQQQITPDPRIWSNPAAQAVQVAGRALGFTDNFAQNLLNAYPKVGGLVQAGLSNGAQAAAEYFPGGRFVNQIALGKGYGQSPAAVLHEGLHRDYDNNPQNRQDFVKAYDATNDPQLRKYLQGRVSPYKSAQGLMDSGGVYKNDFSHIESLPTDLQNEVHSFIPEYYTNVVPTKNQNAGRVLEDGSSSPKVSGISPALANYYKQYYNPSVQKKVNVAQQAYSSGLGKANLLSRSRRK